MDTRAGQLNAILKILVDEWERHLSFILLWEKKFQAINRTLDTVYELRINSERL